MKKISIQQQTIFIFVSKYASIFVNLAISAILARIITPEDFGIVVLVSIFATFFNVIADVGIGTAVVQQRELSINTVNKLFSLTIYFSIILVLFFLIFSIPLTIFYENSVYILLCSLLSVSLLCNTINTIPNAILMRDEQFILVGIRTIIASVGSGSVAIFIALFGGKYYALIAQTIISSALLLCWNYFNTRPKFILKIDFKCLKEIKEFSSYWFGFNIINYLARNLDNLLIGKVFGNIQLGYYDKAYKLMLYPVQNLTYVLNPILHPVLAKEQKNIEIIYQKYIKVLKVLSLIGVFISVFCFFCAKEIIILIFGSQWEASVTAFKILSLSIWFQITNSSSGAIYASINKTKLLFKSGAIYIPIQILLFCFSLLSRNINYVALAATVGLIIKFLIDYYMLIRKGLGYSYIKFLLNFIAEILIFGGCLFGMRMINIDNTSDTFVFLTYNFVICGIVYLILIWVTRQIKYFRNILLIKK